MKSYTLLACLLLAGARPAPAQAPAPNQYADATLRAIATAQDERRTAALLPWLTDKDPRYRAAAAQAFASVQDLAAVPALLPLLADADEAVCRATALALGQGGDSTAASALAQALTRRPGYATRRELAEALGRCATAHSLSRLWQNPVPPPAPDTLQSTSLAWGLYRATLRGLATPELLRRSAALLAARQPRAARLGAAATLARAKWTDSLLSQELAPALQKVARHDRLYAVRAACATALGKAAGVRMVAGPALAIPDYRNAIQRQTVAMLEHLAAHDADHRVRVAALRALPASSQRYPSSRLVVLAALKNRQAAVSLTAAEWLLAHAEGESGKELMSYEEKATGWRARAVLLAASLKATPAAARFLVVGIIKQRYKTASSPYEKGYLLQALAEEPAAFTILEEETFQPSQNHIVAGYGLTALIALRRRADFPQDQAALFAAVLRRALASGNLNQISLAAEVLADKKVYPTLADDDLTALRGAQAGLTLPRDIEAWQSIQTALDQAASTHTPAPLGTARQHPIDWAVVQQIEQNQRVRIQTSRGDIILALKVNEAPGSVASFVTLVRQHFYDGLAFHRVIPNFVAQGGDPRGDGAGSAPYTLRSEFSLLHYQEGSLGLASAGKDTESCQFFFTLQPTPHLDGRYTIFAEVVSGQKAMQELEIGDKMLKVGME